MGKMQVERGFSTFQRGWRVGRAVAMHIYKHRVEFTPHPSPLPEEREPIGGFSELVFTSVLQVGITRSNNSVSSFSLRERARVRGF
jgi:hypothetical protein